MSACLVCRHPNCDALEAPHLVPVDDGPPICPDMLGEGESDEAT